MLMHFTALRIRPGPPLHLPGRVLPRLRAVRRRHHRRLLDPLLLLLDRARRRIRRCELKAFLLAFESRAYLLATAALVLAGVLAVTLSISAFITAAAAGGLLVYRSFTLIKAKGSLIAGVKVRWAQCGQFCHVCRSAKACYLFSPCCQATIAEAKAYISGTASSGSASLMDKSTTVSVKAEDRFLPRNAEGEILPEKPTLGEVMTVKSE